MLAGGLAVAVTGGGETGREGGGGGTEVEIVAANIAFQQTDVTVPAGEPFRIRFRNQDAGVQHDVQIFDNPDYAGTPLFKGEIITGPAEAVYEVPALAAGDYPFDCVIHPTMQGVIHAVEQGGGGAGPKVTVAAENIAFDTDRIELPPDTPATIVFENRDAGVQHNIAIFRDETLADVLFRGELVTGPGSDHLPDPAPAGRRVLLPLRRPPEHERDRRGGRRSGDGRDRRHRGDRRDRRVGSRARFRLAPVRP
jgi:plastocyanin